MNITFLSFGIFFLFAATFFFTSLLTVKRFRIVVLNILFLIMVYGSVSLILGEPKPVNNMPFFTQWDSDDVYVVGGWWNKGTIYLMLKENENIRLYSWPMNDVFLNKIKQAQQERGKHTNGTDRWGFKMKKTYGGNTDDAISNLEFSDPQNDDIIPKNEPDDIGGVHNFHIQ